MPTNFRVMFILNCCEIWRKCFRIFLRIRLKTVLVLLVFLAVSCLVISLAIYRREPGYDTPERDAQWVHWARLSPSCYVPWAPPWIRAPAAFSKRPISQRRASKPRCSWSPKASVVSNDTSVYLRQPYNPMHCCVSPPDRVDCLVIPPRGLQIIDDNGYGPDYVIVKCLRSPKSITFFPFIPLKGENGLETRATTKANASSHGHSVLLLGFTGQSRGDFHRQMPNFFSKMTRAGAQEIRGYGILGEHSLHNTITFLTGLNSKELRLKCWKGPTSTFDSCPFIWKEFKKKGYWTMRASDCPDLDVLDGPNGGFLRQPTDYDFRPVAVHSDQIGTLPIHSTSSQCNVCAGEYSRLEMMMTYVEKFARRFQHEKYWAMAWCHSLSQNNSTGADLYYSQLMTTAEKEGFFENTVIIVVSDIGANEQGYRKTYEGQLEMRLPLLSILLPRSFKERYPKETEALARNTKRIVSPINLHNTMLHITELLPPSSDNHTQNKKVTRKNKDALKKNPKTDQVRKTKLSGSSTKKVTRKNKDDLKNNTVTDQVRKAKLSETSTKKDKQVTRKNKDDLKKNPKTDQVRKTKLSESSTKKVTKKNKDGLQKNPKTDQVRKTKLSASTKKVTRKNKDDLKNNTVTDQVRKAKLSETSTKKDKKVTKKNKDDLKKNPKTDQVRKAKLPESSAKKGINRRTARSLVKTHGNNRKISLFRPIRENQFCFDTGIDKQWCPCHNPQAVDEVNYQQVIDEISDYLVSFINKALEPFSKFCEEMSTGAAIGLWRLVPPQALRIFPSRMANRLAYSYVLKMNISSASRSSVFVTSMVHEWTKEENRWYTNVESIQIIGKHHNDSKCISDIALQKLCHCRKK